MKGCLQRLSGHKTHTCDFISQMKRTGSRCHRPLPLPTNGFYPREYLYQEGGVGGGRQFLESLMRVFRELLESSISFQAKIYDLCLFQTFP